MMNVGTVWLVALGLVGCSVPPPEEEAAQDPLQLLADGGPPHRSTNTTSCRFGISGPQISRQLNAEEVGPLDRGELHWSVTLTDEAGARTVARVDHQIDGLTVDGNRRLPPSATARIRNPFDGQEFFRNDATGELQWPDSILINDEAGSLRASAGKPGYSLIDGSLFAVLIRNKTGHRWFLEGKEITTIHYNCVKGRLDDN